MLTLKECEKILRDNGFEMPEGFDLRELRDYLYWLAKLQIENEEKCTQNASQLCPPQGPDTG